MNGTKSFNSSRKGNMIEGILNINLNLMLGFYCNKTTDRK